eukprot:gene928-284_t
MIIQQLSGNALGRTCSTVHATTANCFKQQVRFRRAKRYEVVGRRTRHQNVRIGSRKSSRPWVLVPPYFGIHEARVMLHLSYDDAFDYFGVHVVAKKYYWKDHEGRTFETVNRRKVYLPWEMVAARLAAWDYLPIMIDMEPEWKSPISNEAPITSFVVLGHINHGKTTLLNVLRGRQEDEMDVEPGGITQDLKAFTMEWPTSLLEHIRDRLSKPQQEAHIDFTKSTFFDTPGHCLFDILRGRGASIADCAVVVISLENGADIQTEEVLTSADRFKTPVVFALTKSDLEFAHVDLTRAELKRQCREMYENGTLSHDFSTEIDNAVPVSAVNGDGIVELLTQMYRSVAAHGVPQNVIESQSLTPGVHKEYEDAWRRSDYLIQSHHQPIGVGVVIEVGQDDHIGRHVMVMVKVCGTAFGRVRKMYAAGEDFKVTMHKAQGGNVVHISGMWKQKVEGLRNVIGCAADDLLYCLPKERAWRIAEYRKMLESLANCQVSGPPMKFSWEADPPMLENRTQADFERDGVNAEGKEKLGRWARRLERLKKNEKFGNDEEDQVAVYGSLKANEKNARVGGRQNQSILMSPADDQSEQYDKEEVKELKPNSRLEDIPGLAESSYKPGGRKSKKGEKPGLYKGLEDGVGAERDFIYYTERNSWQEESKIDNRRYCERHMEIADNKMRQREEEHRLGEAAKQLGETVRRRALGLPDPADMAMLKTSALVKTAAPAPRLVANCKLQSEAVTHCSSVYVVMLLCLLLTKEQIIRDRDGDSEEEEPYELPESAPVVPIILKTDTTSMFSALMDELEDLSRFFKMKLPVVHGGVGMVKPTDVNHAEIERSFGYCPIYAFRVKTHHQAKAEAQQEGIEIKEYKVFTEFLADVAKRCQIVKHKAEYADKMREVRIYPTVPDVEDVNDRLHRYPG